MHLLFNSEGLLAVTAQERKVVEAARHLYSICMRWPDDYGSPADHERARDNAIVALTDNVHHLENLERLYAGR